MYIGSTVKNTSDSNIERFEISIPESDEKIQEWTEKISKPYNDYIDKTKEYQQLESQIQIDIQKMIKENPCDKVKLGDLLIINDKKYKKYETSFGKLTGKYRFHTGSSNGKYYCDNINILVKTIIINKTNGSGKCNVFNR